MRRGLFCAFRAGFHNPGQKRRQESGGTIDNSLFFCYPCIQTSIRFDNRGTGCFALAIPQKGDGSHEAHSDFEFQKPEGVSEGRRLRRVPDLLPVCLQDLLHGCEPALRKQEEIRAVSMSIAAPVLGGALCAPWIRCGDICCAYRFGKG